VKIEIRQLDAGRLALYGQVPIAFEVRTIYEIIPVEAGLGGLSFRERSLEIPYIKDYDAMEPPQLWSRQFDLANWGIFVMSSDQRPLGGACVAFNTEGVDMLEGRDDLAVLWDIRIHPADRGQGAGTRLFQHAADWARARGCTQLKIETQNTNVPACNFYARQGCILGSIRRYGYAADANFAHEVMLLWYLDL
jgi:ribosomal protein S18 acetylase RimI-like enzyme